MTINTIFMLTEREAHGFNERNPMKVLAFASLALLTVAGCGQTSSASDRNNAADEIAAVRNEPAIASGTSAAPGPSANVQHAGGGHVDLTPYIGKYPFDVIGGHRFLDNPTVKAAIAAAVPDPKERAAVKYEDGGLGTPIVKVKGGRLLLWGGENRAEDRYNWAVVIAPDGTKPEVCIYDGLGYDEDFQSSQWFEPGRPSVMKQGKCPSESGDYPAADIAAG